MASFIPMVSWSPYYQYMSFGDHIQTIIFCPWLPKSLFLHWRCFIKFIGLKFSSHNPNLHSKPRISYSNQIWIHWDRNIHQSWKCGMKASLLLPMYNGVSGIGQFLPPQERKIGKQQTVTSLQYVQSLTEKTGLIKSSKVKYFGFTTCILYTLVWTSTHRNSGISAPHSLPEDET